MSSRAALDPTISRAGNLPSYKVDDSLIFLDREGGLCYELNRTGVRIWDLIETPMSISSLCTSLCEEFNVDRDTCERDVVEILDAMRKADLVRSL
jgi:hypothetical protein